MVGSFNSHWYAQFEILNKSILERTSAAGRESGQRSGAASELSKPSRNGALSAGVLRRGRSGRLENGREQPRVVLSRVLLPGSDRIIPGRTLRTAQGVRLQGRLLRQAQHAAPGGIDHRDGCRHRHRHDRGIHSLTFLDVPRN